MSSTRLGEPYNYLYFMLVFVLLIVMPSINIAVTGCGHGELDTFYRMCDVFSKNGKKVDLLIITGDFQAMRNQEDLGCMKCPLKYMFMVCYEFVFQCRWIFTNIILERK